MALDQESKSHKFMALPQTRVFAEIVDQVRQAILSKELKPGDKLPSERELARQFKTGRISVREALRTLEQAGLIVVRQGSEGGAFVREVDTSLISESIFDLIRRVDLNLEDITEIRTVIEHLIIEKALKVITPEAMEQLDRTIRDLEAAWVEADLKGGGTPDLAFAVATNVDFHLIMARATKSPLLELIMESLMKANYQFLTKAPPSPEQMRRHLSYHRSIYEAFRERNLQRAKEELDRHNLHVLSTFLKTRGGKEGG